jgi:hypothetical protein
VVNNITNNTYTTTTTPTSTVPTWVPQPIVQLLNLDEDVPLAALSPIDPDPVPQVSLTSLDDDETPKAALAPQTGDNFNITLWTVLLSGSAFVIIVMFAMGIRKKIKNKNR